MSDRIGDMSERLLETQRIQGENMDRMQDSMVEVMKTMAEIAKANAQMAAAMTAQGVDLNPLD